MHSIIITFMVFEAIALVCHWLVLLILMFVNFGMKKNYIALGYLISLVITAIVGFGACTTFGKF